jgi:trypsin
MKFLATFLTTLATGQAVAAFNDSAPTRNLKGRQVVAKPETTTQKTKPLEMLSSTQFPAESLIVEGFSKQVVAKPEPMIQKTKPLKMPHSTPMPAESRIVGGTDAQPGAYPFFVQGVDCGGSLIWDDIVLTAAHCTYGFPVGDSALVGNYILNNASGGAESIDVAQQVPHPLWDDSSKVYDVMLLKLNHPVTNPNLTPIALNSVESNPAYNDVLTMLGFGYTSFPLPFPWQQPSRLQEVNLTHVDSEWCDQKLSESGFLSAFLGSPLHINDSLHFCAGDGEKSGCYSDSGGPTFDQEGTQVGVTSNTFGCGYNNFPGVFQRVSAVKDWIDATICEASSSPPASCFAGNNEVVIEVKHDNYPEETGWTLCGGAGTLIANQTTGSYDTVGGTVTETAFVTEGAYTFEITDTWGDGICCQEGSGEFKITVNG